mgnify:CR=1 FL=1
MGAASFLLSPAQQLLTDGSVPLESLYISDLSFFYDADGDGVKEYYAIGEGQWRNENNRYVWRAPGVTCGRTRLICLGVTKMKVGSW